jgi:Fur family transcriptional regulator, peroxide stress response regulator
MQTSAAQFKDLCRRHNLSATHQRQVIYETLHSLPGHPSPEAVYEKVRKHIPSVSLATVYKNIKTFVDSGMVREVSLHHGALRIDPNVNPHHHLVCAKCKAVIDVDEQTLTPIALKKKLPNGFQVERFSVEIIGLCQRCSKSSKKNS